MTSDTFKIYGITHLEEVWQKLTLHPITGKSKIPPIGVDGMSVQSFEKKKLQYFNEIIRLLHSQGHRRYHFAPLLEMERSKPGGGFRKLYIPRLRDQLVLRMIHDDLIHHLNFSRQRSPVYVMDHLRRSIHENKPAYALKADLSNFFASVPRSKVLKYLPIAPLHPFTPELLEIWSSELMVRPAWSVGKSRDYSISGLPQGVSISSPLSELWAHILDQKLQETGLTYFRYVDDLIFLVNTETQAHQALSHLIKITHSLDLTLSLDKTMIIPFERGVPWLGLIHTQNDVRIESGRKQKWFKRIAGLRRDFGNQLSQAHTEQARRELEKEFLKHMREEAQASSNFRLRWYAHVSQIDQWSEIDHFIYQQVLSFYRQLKSPLPPNLKLPSVQKAITMIRQQLQEEGILS